MTKDIDIDTARIILIVAGDAYYTVEPELSHESCAGAILLLNQIVERVLPVLPDNDPVRRATTEFVRCLHDTATRLRAGVSIH